jgi:hypothetical protein
MTFQEWLQQGYDNGWCGPSVCYTHDGLPMSDLEFQEFEDGNDPCMHVIRLYEDVEQKTQIEENHSPSQWRAAGEGLIA